MVASILGILDQKPRRFTTTVYKEVELNETKKTDYNEPLSPLQREIEMSLTNGRGYLSIQNALDVVNENSPKMSLYDVLDTDMVPLNLIEYQITKTDFENPCDEIHLGELTPVIPFSYYPMEKTLLEELRAQQEINGLRNLRSFGGTNPELFFNL